MIAVKRNKEYTILDAQKNQYVKDGFDIYEDGVCIQQGIGKMVPAEQLQKALEEADALRKKLQKAQAGSAPPKK